MTYLISFNYMPHSSLIAVPHTHYHIRSTFCAENSLLAKLSLGNSSQKLNFDEWAKEELIMCMIVYKVFSCVDGVR